MADLLAVDPSAFWRCAAHNAQLAVNDVIAQGGGAGSGPADRQRARALSLYPRVNDPARAFDPTAAVRTTKDAAARRFNALAVNVLYAGKIHCPVSSSSGGTFNSCCFVGARIF